jgi:hypothetical protein
MQRSDPAGRQADLLPQVGRADHFDIWSEREYVEHRGLNRIEPDRGPDPALPAIALVATTPPGQTVFLTSTALGPTSTALGPTSTALGPTSTALGPTSTALGPTSTAIGPTSTALGPTSTAVGGLGNPADPEVGRPAKQRRQPAAPRRQSHPRPAAAGHARGRAKPGLGHGQLVPEPVHQLESALGSTDRVHGNAGDAERLDVAQDSALGDLQPGGKLLRRHPATSLQ